MAQEKATITFSLEDDFSAKMQEIVGKLEDFKRKLDDTAKSGQEGFRKTAEQVKQVGDHSAGANASLRSMSTYMKDAFAGFNQQMAGSVRGLTAFEATLATIGPRIQSLSSGFGVLATRAGTMAGAAAAAGSAIYLLGRHLAQSYEQSRLLETRLGMTNAQIENMSRLWARIGKGPEDAIRAMDALVQRAMETRRGVESATRQALEKGILGQAGTDIANRVEDILTQLRDKQISPDEANRRILKQVYGVQTSEEVKRVIAKAVGQTYEEMELALKQIDKVIPAVPWSKQMEEALDRLSDTTHDGLEKVGNAWREGWNKLGPEGVDEINAAITAMQNALIAAMPTIISTMSRLIAEIKQVTKEGLGSLFPKSS